MILLYETDIELCDVLATLINETDICLKASTLEEAQSHTKRKPTTVFIGLNHNGDELHFIDYLREAMYPIPNIVVLCSSKQVLAKAELYNPDCILEKPFSIDSIYKIIFPKKT